VQHTVAAETLLSALADTLADLLVGEYEAGASVLQVFESSAGELSPADWRRFSAPYLRRIEERFHSKVPRVSEGGPPLILFARGAHHAIEEMAGVYDVIGVDWAIEPSEAVKRASDDEGKRKCRAFQGNLDPGILYGDDATIRERTAEMLESFGRSTPLIANLGWGMHPSHEPRALRAYFQAVHDLSSSSTGSSV
jgi:uroporphyrinogen decarboxylase